MVVSLIAGFAPIVLLGSGYAEVVEPPVLHGWFRLRGPRPVPQSVTIARIDKPAYDKVNLSPGEMFPRNHMAEAIEAIAEHGAKLIVIDAVAQRPGNDPKADEQLAQALKRTPTVIARGTETVIDSDLTGQRRKTQVQHKPIPLFAESAKSVIPMHVRLTGGRVEHIHQTSAPKDVSGTNVPLINPLRTFVRADVEEPGPWDFINFYGPPSTLPSLSLAELIGDGEGVSSDYFRDRVVFIGAQSGTGTGAEAGKDSFLTSASNEWMFGVEIHATIAANLLDGSYLRRLPLLAEGLLLGLILFASSLSVLSLSLSSGAAVAFLIAALWLGVSYYAFLKLFYFLPAAMLTLVLVLLVVLRWAAVATLLARRRKRRLPAENQSA